MRINRLRRRELLTFLGGAVATSVAWPLTSRAQQAGKPPTSRGVAVMTKVEPDLVAAEITPRGGKEREAARALQAMGFRVHAVGATISIDAPRERWKDAFAARFAPVQRKEKGRTPGSRGVCPARVARCVSNTGSARAAGGERCLRRAARAFLKGGCPPWLARLLRSTPATPAGSPTIKGELCRIGEAVRLKIFFVNCELFHS